MVVETISCLAGPRLKAGPHESLLPNMDEAVTVDADSSTLASDMDWYIMKE